MPHIYLLVHAGFYWRAYDFQGRTLLLNRIGPVGQLIQF